VHSDEAIQHFLVGSLDCFVAMLLAMTRGETGPMRKIVSRRDIIKGSAALGLTAFAASVKAAAPEPVSITPALVEAARNEARVILYSAMDLPIGEKLGKAFEAQYQGIAVQIERAGSERLFQRVDQEFSSGIRTVDVVSTTDASHIIAWKRNGWLAPFVTEDIARHFPPEYRDPDGMSATSRIYLSSIAYNTNLVKPADAPTSYADLLDPKWAGKMIKGHPAYSGTIMTATYELVRELGWDYLEKLSKQRVMQVQSSTDPPKKLSLGERAVMADGNEYGVVLLKEAGQPVEPVYPAEGTPTISGPTGIFATAPHPNAARLFQAWLHTRETQQFFCDFTAQYSLHDQVQPKPGRRRISDIKLMKEDPAGVEKMTEEIKTRYARLFRV
jgi:iron(III) transport system substrate-binding protein